MDSFTTGLGYGGGSSSKFAINRPGSMSETNLLKYRPHKDGGPMSTVRPESALGLLQGMIVIVYIRVVIAISKYSNFILTIMILYLILKYVQNCCLCLYLFKFDWVNIL